MVAMYVENLYEHFHPFVRIFFLMLFFKAWSSSTLFILGKHVLQKQPVNLKLSNELVDHQLQIQACSEISKSTEMLHFIFYSITCSVHLCDWHICNCGDIARISLYDLVESVQGVYILLFHIHVIICCVY